MKRVINDNVYDIETDIKGAQLTCIQELLSDKKEETSINPTFQEIVLLAKTRNNGKNTYIIPQLRVPYNSFRINRMYLKHGKNTKIVSSTLKCATIIEELSAPQIRLLNKIYEMDESSPVYTPITFGFLASPHWICIPFEDNFEVEVNFEFSGIESCEEKLIIQFEYSEHIIDTKYSIHQSINTIKLNRQFFGVCNKKSSVQRYTFNEVRPSCVTSAIIFSTTLPITNKPKMFGIVKNEEFIIQFVFEKLKHSYENEYIIKFDECDDIMDINKLQTQEFALSRLDQAMLEFNEPQPFMITSSYVYQHSMYITNCGKILKYFC